MLLDIVGGAVRGWWSAGTTPRAGVIMRQHPGLARRGKPPFAKRTRGRGRVDGGVPASALLAWPAGGLPPARTFLATAAGGETFGARPGARAPPKTETPAGTRAGVIMRQHPGIGRRGKSPFAKRTRGRGSAAG